MQVYSRIISGNIGNAGGLNAALNQPKRSRLSRHDIIQKKHSIIQRSIKSPPEYCIPTVERLYGLYLLPSFDRLNRKQHRLQIFTVKVYLPLVILPFGIRYFNPYITVECVEQVFQ